MDFVYIKNIYKIHKLYIKQKENQTLNFTKMIKKNEKLFQHFQSINLGIQIFEIVNVISHGVLPREQN